MGRCTMTCFDKQKQQFGPNPDEYPPDKLKQFEASLKTCFSKCADDHLALLPSIKDRILKSLK